MRRVWSDLWLEDLEDGMETLKDAANTARGPSLEH